MDKATKDEEKLQTDQIRLVRLRQEYARFSKGVDLPMQHERAEVADFTWKDGKAAEKAYKAAEKAGASGGSIEKSGAERKKGKPNANATGKTEKAISDVMWEENRGTSAWSDSKKKRLVSAEYKSVKEPCEYGILYDENGKRIFRKKGDANSVEFTSSEIRQMRGGVLTHNHPGADYGCFSPADIEMLRESHLSEVRVATPVGVFSLQRPKKWPTNINGLDKIRKAYYDIDSTVGSEYFARAYRGEMSLLEADNLGQRAVIEELCKQYRIPFRFDSWENLGKESYESILRSNS